MEEARDLCEEKKARRGEAAAEAWRRNDTDGQEGEREQSRAEGAGQERRGMAASLGGGGEWAIRPQSACGSLRKSRSGIARAEDGPPIRLIVEWRVFSDEVRHRERFGGL